MTKDQKAKHTAFLNSNIIPLMDDGDCNKINHPLTLSSSAHSWWDFHHNATCPPTPSSTISWNNTAAIASLVIPWENQNNSNSSPCDHEDVSITASSHSSLKVDESCHRFVESSSSSNIAAEPTYYSSNLWSQLLLGVAGSHKMQGEMRDEVGENLLEALSLKSFSNGMVEPLPCSDYLEKFDTYHHGKWVDNKGDNYPNSNTCSSFDNNPDSIRSLAPSADRSPMVHHLVPHPCNVIPPIDQHLHPDHIYSDQSKHNAAYQRQLRDMEPSAGNSGFDYYSCMFNHARLDTYHQEESDHAGPSSGALMPMKSNMHNKHGFTRSFNDPFNQLRSSLASKPALLKSLNLLETRKRQGIVRNEGDGRGQVASTSTNEGKKKRSYDTSQSCSSLKKFKHEGSSSNPPSDKVKDSQTPKVKIAAEKISVLQQIVSPYGKTDTASVLQEAIGFIKCHQEQVMLLSNHYLKSSVNKLQEAWQSMDRKLENGKRTNKGLDLKSKGLCLVPTSSIPQVYMDRGGPDYWPAYRGYMY